MRKILSLLTIILLVNISQAQVLVDDTNTGRMEPESGVALELNSENKGLVIPRLTTAAINNIPGEEGMIVFDVDLQCYKGFSNSTWQNVGNTCPTACDTTSNLVAFDFSDNNSTTSALWADDVATHINNAKISLGSGLSIIANPESFYAQGADATSLDEAVANNDYFEVDFDVANGATANFTAFNFNWSSATNTDLNVALRSSKDSFATDLGFISGLNSSLNNVLEIYGHNDNAGPITFRLYVWGANDANESFGFTGTDLDITVSGCVQGGTLPANLQMIQNFDDILDWQYITTPPAYVPNINNNNNDTWGELTPTDFPGLITDLDDNFWAMKNENNANPGIMNHTVTFATQDISGLDNVRFSFDYSYANLDDNVDLLTFEPFVDGESLGIRNICTGCGSRRNGGYSITNDIVDTASTFSVKFYFQHNGDNKERMAIDNIRLTGTRP